MLSKVEKFHALSGPQKMQLLQAYFLLGVMRVSVLIMPFKSLCKTLQHHSTPPESEPLGQAELDQAKSIGWAVTTAARFTPWESNCLAQALAAQRMLKRRHIAGMFFLGLEKKEDGLEAHAWLQCGNTILTGEAGHEKFQIMSTFSWA